VTLDEDGFVVLTAEETFAGAVRDEVAGCPCDDHCALRADDWYEALALVLAERSPA